ncbi:hypothetical protein [Tengunoibacter tsumagoiensis]|uniref:Uncharacterized protein n=1 Tax=Tengunoibacter tsumagoiensis TaxID=2014871 RepID=A0A401ZTQ0_9CHLR|nr:hypothetical protein [Tengunoibacter tsumagoiensis]GCE10237.1 hypothetical protein KTT_00960 [Tengunoibacter tsumagoiensis]
MFNNQPDPSTPVQQQPGSQQWTPHSAPTERFVRKPIGPEQLIRQPASPLPKNPVQRMGQLWKSDPAYKVLFIAIGTILLSGLVGAILLTSWIFSSAQPSSTNSASATTPGAKVSVVSQNTPTPVPTAQPTPIPTIVPAILPTTAPTAPPTPTPDPNTPLTVDCNGLPGQAQNRTTLSVSIHTNKPGVSVKLTVIYNALPGFYNSSTVTTDSQGNASVPWKIAVQTFQHNTKVTATVTAIAQSATGQSATSQPIKVQIIVN